MADKKQPWLRVPIRIGRPGYYSDPTVDPYADPLVNTDLTVGPYVGPNVYKDAAGGISTLYGKAGEMIRRLTPAGKAPKIKEDRETRERPAFKLGPVPGPDPTILNYALNQPNMVRPDYTPVLPPQAVVAPSQAVIDPTTILEDRATREKAPEGWKEYLDRLAENLPGKKTLDSLGNRLANSDIMSNAFERVYPPSAGALAGQPMPETVWRSNQPESGAGRNAFDIITGQTPDLSRTPYELTEAGGGAYDHDALQKAVDAAPYGQPQAGPSSVPQPPVAPPPPPPVPSPLADVLEDRATRERRADPSAPVNPANPEEPPAPVKETSPVLTQLPAGTATGALSIDDYLETIKKAYPDLDFQKNPAQDLADANARRDLDRTALLAQLSFASGIVSGAGKSWEGIGQGFASAAGTYDKGFEKYQNALQSSADRYQRQQEQAMTYDTARRQAALGLYTSATTNAAENERLNIKMANDRIWDEHKLNVEGERQTAKQNQESVDKVFANMADKLKPDADDDPDTAARKVQQLQALYESWQESNRLGEVVLPQNHNIDAMVANK